MVMLSYARRSRLQRLIDLKIAPTETLTRERYLFYRRYRETRSRLEAKTGVRDEELLDRILRSGLTEETVVALPLLPVALTAWASGEVTADEAIAAEFIVFDRSMSIGGGASIGDAAVEQFRQWLQNRPDETWVKLWLDYSEQRRQIVGDIQHYGLGVLIHEVATRVAKASGGWFGYGSVCSQEAEMLSRIREVHRLDRWQ